MDDTKTPCRGKCGKTKDMSATRRIFGRLGLNRPRKPMGWLCAECFKKELASKP